jgi:hypothetical protein
MAAAPRRGSCSGGGARRWLVACGTLALLCVAAAAAGARAPPPFAAGGVTDLNIANFDSEVRRAAAVCVSDRNRCASRVVSARARAGAAPRAASRAARCARHAAVLLAWLCRALTSQTQTALTRRRTPLACLPPLPHSLRAGHTWCTSTPTGAHVRPPPTPPPPPHKQTRGGTLIPTHTHSRKTQTASV